MNQQQLRRIGAGFCGTVWSATETGSAFKREDGGPSRSLLHDFRTHQHILHCMRQKSDRTTGLVGSTHRTDTRHNVNIPLCHGFIKSTDDWWMDNRDRFPQECEPCNMTEMQRIPPVPEDTRRFLTERYCPPRISSQILSSETNRDCLIRPYLGRRRIRPTSGRFSAFSLRNYPLHLDQMEEIGIPEGDVLRYARTMAKALAQLHWMARIDGNDVEFVLASPSKHLDKATPAESWDNALGRHEMWMFDFDLARNMSMDEQGTRQAANAFLKNDPYYPRPHQDPPLWTAFREQYLTTSEDCLRNEANQTLRELPPLFIHLVEEFNVANGH